MISILDIDSYFINLIKHTYFFTFGKPNIYHIVKPIMYHISSNKVACSSHVCQWMSFPYFCVFGNHAMHAGMHGQYMYVTISSMVGFTLLLLAHHATVAGHGSELRYHDGAMVISTGNSVPHHMTVYCKAAGGGEVGVSSHGGHGGPDVKLVHVVRAVGLPRRERPLRGRQT
jgi:hypothetical protein